MVFTRRFDVNAFCGSVWVQLQGKRPQKAPSKRPKGKSLFLRSKAHGLVFSTVYLWGSSAPSRCSPRLCSGPGVSPKDKPLKDGALPPVTSQKAFALGHHHSTIYPEMSAIPQRLPAGLPDTGGRIGVVGGPFQNEETKSDRGKACRQGAARRAERFVSHDHVSPPWSFPGVPPPASTVA